MTVQPVNITTLLDEGYAQVLAEDFAGMQSFLAKLTAIRSAVSANDVSSLQQIIQAHPLFQILLLDPYTNRAFNKPRNFAGDAELIDLFYGFKSSPEFVDKIGRRLFEELMRLPSCDAVRYRRAFYGQFIDTVAEAAGGSATVMSLACGHLREVAFSRAATSGKGVKVYGIDSDQLAIQEASAYLAECDIELRNASVIDFIRHRAWGQTFDAVYSAGLFDYLDEKIARKVISAAFTSLKPGGEMSIANFQPHIQERGYMDLVMDWQLIYRTREQFMELASHLNSTASVSSWTDPMNSVVYLSIRKER